MRFALPLSALAAALALSACQSMPRTAQVPAATPAPVAAAAPAPAPAALPNDNLNATVWMQQTVEYAAVTQTVYRAAESRLDQALKDKTWNALVPEEREKPDASLPPAVIVDVDETVLDNSPYQARLVRSGGEYDEATWADWVHARKARAIPGAVAFAQAAAARGITVLYISNRATDLDADTLENLKAEGFPIKDASVFMGLGTFVPGCEQNGSEKDCRRRLWPAAATASCCRWATSWAISCRSSATPRKAAPRCSGSIATGSGCAGSCCPTRPTAAGNRRCSTTTGPSPPTCAARPSRMRCEPTEPRNAGYGRA